MDLEIFKHELDEKTKEFEAKVHIFDKRVAYFEKQKSSLEKKAFLTNQINEVNNLIALNNPEGFMDCCKMELMHLLQRSHVLVVLFVVVFLIKHYMNGGTAAQLYNPFSKLTVNVY